jgi:hypothetical protein
MIDHQSLGWLALSGAALGLLVLLAAFIPPDTKAVSLDTDLLLKRVTITIPPAPPPTVALANTSKGAAPSKSGASPARSRRSGTTRAAAPHPTVAGTGSVGIINVLQHFRGNEVFQRSTALDPGALLGGLLGTDGATAFAVNGLGIRGTGAGPDGQLEGEGVLSTVGRGRPGSDGVAYANRVGNLPQHRARPPEVQQGIAQVRGTLDREIVRRVIRQHLNEVRYCYEQALPRKPQLAGRVVAHFAILATGATSAVAIGESTLGDVRVEACIAQAVRRWDFPRPRDGGLALVSYPFVLVAPGLQ